jgi:L-asparaginase II
MTLPGYLPMVELTRGSIVESFHTGAVAVVDAEGRLVASYGDVDALTFLRSSAKPFQALPFIESGGDQAFDLSGPEVAVICASHSGTDEHVAVVESIQKKIGVSEKDLLCGTHTPSHEPTQRALILRQAEPTPNRHNCSGKHTGMLAHAVLRRLPTADYINPNHAVQHTILTAFAEMTGLPVEAVVTGIDGCSAPNFAVPLRHAALGYARLIDPHRLSPARAQACQRIVSAMTSYPNMVAGPGRFDTALMELGRGSLLSKGGAEGYQCIGIAPGVLGPGSPGLGIALKIADGDVQGRAGTVAAVEVLRQLGVLSAGDLDALQRFSRRPLENFRKLRVGEIRPCFELLNPPDSGRVNPPDSGRVKA